MSLFVDLPEDILGVIYNYLHAADRHALFKFTLVCKDQRHQTFKLLDSVRIDFDSRPNAADFRGVAPRVATLFELPPTKGDIEALKDILAFATSVKWVLTDDFYKFIPGMETVGDAMTRLTSLSFSDDTCKPSLPHIAQWMPKLTNLTELEMPWVQEMNEILTNVPSTLKRLTIKGEPTTALAELKTSLSRFDRLQMLMLPGAFAEMDDIVSAIARNNVHEIEEGINAIADALPHYLADFKRVFVYVERGEGVFSPVHFFSELYRFCSHSETIKLVLDHLVRVGINSVSDVDGDTALCNALAYGVYVPGKIKALIDAGADVWRQHAIICPSRVPAVGNALHIAAAYGAPSITKELLESIDWEYVKQADFEPLKSSTGFTPIHFLSTAADNWPVLYEAIRKIFPDVLSDNNNVCATTPLQSLFLLREKEVISLQSVLDTADCIIATHPAVVQESLPRLFALAFDFFACFALSEMNILQRIKSFLNRILEALKTKLASSNGGVVPELSRSMLGFPDYETEPRLRCLAIFGAYMFEESLLEVVVRDEPPAVLSTALVYCSGFTVDVPKVRKMLDLLISNGADINYSSGTVSHGATALFVFLHNLTPSHLLFIDQIQYSKLWDEFWSCLWLFIDRGALCKHRGELMPVFPQGAPASLFASQAKTVEIATKFVRYLLDFGMRQDVVDFALGFLNPETLAKDRKPARAVFDLIEASQPDLIDENFDRQQLRAALEGPA